MMKAENRVKNGASHDGPVDTRWFQNSLKDLRVSQRELAGMLGVDASAVTLMLRGRRKMTAAEAALISRVLGVGVDEVMRRAGLDPRRAMVSEGKGMASAVSGGDGSPSGKGGSGVSAGEDGVVVVPVPLSDGRVVQIPLPVGLKREDAAKIAAIVVAFGG